MKTLNQNTNSEYFYESKLFFENTESIYNVAWHLCLQVAKRMRKNLPVDFDHLAGCSTVKAIASMTNREAAKYGEKPLRTRKDFADFKVYVAARVIEWADYEVKKIA